jgi:uncharacterized membrane protein
LIDDATVARPGGRRTPIPDLLFTPARLHFTPRFPRFVPSGSPVAQPAGTVRPSNKSQERNAMQLTPIIAVHMTAALGALVTGPVALWARLGAVKRPRLHRAFGYAWVTLMVVTAVSAMFIRDFRLPNLAGFTPIHLLVPATLAGLFGAFRALFKGDIAGHKKLMQRLYMGACVTAGAFTLLPGRYLGNLVWHEWLGLASETTTHPQGAPAMNMISQVLSGTPTWVWALLAGLIALGVSQARDRSASLGRIALMPVAMTAFSIYGTVSTFSHSLMLSSVLMTWGVLAAVVFSIVGKGPAAGTYDPATRVFALPGSWVPMALILGIFATKYVANVALAIHPELVNDGAFSLTQAALYGVFTGLFTGRAARLVRMALMAHRTGVPAQA